MGSFVVTKSWLVDAGTPEEAVDAVGDREPSFVKTGDASARATFVWDQFYATPQEILDAVWDRYHQRDHSGDPRDYKMPTFVQLSLAGLDTNHISVLFDLAIETYRDVFEGRLPHH
jgi:hypothetical protein